MLADVNSHRRLWPICPFTLDSSIGRVAFSAKRARVHEDLITNISAQLRHPNMTTWLHIAHKPCHTRTYAVEFPIRYP